MTSSTVQKPTANDLYRECQQLAKQGQPVFPCWPTGERVKAPMTRNGLKDATTDTSQIKRWWQKNRDAAIGMPTGIVWDVLDVDVKNGQDGRGFLPRLLRHGLLDGCQKLIRTPSGGWHLYFPASGQQRNKSRGSLGLDVRGVGGYVLAPPSWIDNGGSSTGVYELVDTPTDGTKEPLMWDLILATIAPEDEDTGDPITLPSLERQASVAALKSWLFDRESGERNNALHWAVRRCLDSGIDPNELEEVALHIGLTEFEVRATIDGAIKRTGADVSELLSEVEAVFGTD